MSLFVQFIFWLLWFMGSFLTIQNCLFIFSYISHLKILSPCDIKKVCLFYILFNFVKLAPSVLSFLTNYTLKHTSSPYFETITVSLYVGTLPKHYINPPSSLPLKISVTVHASRHITGISAESHSICVATIISI